MASSLRSVSQSSSRLALGEVNSIRETCWNCTSVIARLEQVVKSRTKDVQERVLQTEELVTVGSHCIGG